MSKTISIIGCGWLGFPLAQVLLKGGYRVKGTTTREAKLPKLAEAGIEGHLFSIADYSTKTLQELGSSDVIFLNIPPGRSNPERARSYPIHLQKLIQFWQTNQDMQLLFASSTSMYGARDEIVTETSKPNPSTLSANGIYEVEKNIQQTFANRATILRFAGLIGENRHPARFLAGKTNLSKPKAAVNLVHLTDCIQVITKIIEKNKWGETYNVCSDEHPSRKIYYQHQAQSLNLPLPSFDLTDETKGKIVSNAKIKQDLQHQFQSIWLGF